MAYQNIIAIIFDCDDTLCEDSISYLISYYGLNVESFWKEVDNLVEVGTDPPLAYMHRIVDLIKAGEMPDLNNAKLRELGRDLNFYSGIPGIFEELPQFVNGIPEFMDVGIKLEFYVITGGFEEMIKGSCIAEHMTDIFGCTFYEDPDTGLLCKPKSAVTFTEKTKFVYAINKGITSNELRRDPYRVNDACDYKDRKIPFTNMIYLGDGPSDIPCFSLIQKLGAANGSIGHVIGVYSSGKSRKGYELARGDRITVGPYSTDYTKDSDLRKGLEENIQDIAWDIVRKRNITFKGSVRH